MMELDAGTAIGYLRAANRVLPAEPVAIRELSGGVSNIVLLVTLPERGERSVPGGGLRFVLKQARGKLRVKEEWLCPIERIWREVETLRICGDLLLEPLRITDCGLRIVGQPAFQPCVPQVLWEDRENFCFAMTAAPEAHTTWKELLLRGELPVSLGVATACGQMLAALHAGSWGNADIAARLDDRTFFDQLRIDPYYRHVAKVHPDLTPQIQQLIDSVWSHRLCLVHGDFSPKNLLIWQDHAMLIDFEVGHYGDPAFDIGFFLTHLVLKAIWSGPRRERYLALATAFWNTYRSGLNGSVSANDQGELERRTLWNLAGCMLARVDGKSPVEYLTEAQREVVRKLSRRWIESPAQTLDDAIGQLAASTEY